MNCKYIVFFINSSNFYVQNNHFNYIVIFIHLIRTSFIRISRNKMSLLLTDCWKKAFIYFS